VDKELTRQADSIPVDGKVVEGGSQSVLH